MKELIRLLLKLDMKALFMTPTQNSMVQFFRYAFVGGIASVADWGALWLLERWGIYYLLAAVFAFFVGLGVNFALSKALVFAGERARVGGVGEFAGYAAIGAVGLGMTIGLMALMTEGLGLFFMVSKIIATAVVLAWNFLARKIFLYKG